MFLLAGLVSWNGRFWRRDATDQPVYDVRPSGTRSARLQLGSQSDVRFGVTSLRSARDERQDRVFAQAHQFFFCLVPCPCLTQPPRSPSLTRSLALSLSLKSCVCCRQTIVFVGFPKSVLVFDRNVCGFLFQRFIAPMKLERRSHARQVAQVWPLRYASRFTVSGECSVVFTFVSSVCNWKKKQLIKLQPCPTCTICWMFGYPSLIFRLLGCVSHDLFF